MRDLLRADAAEQKLAACETVLRRDTDRLQAELDRASAQILELRGANRAAAIAAAQRAASAGQQPHPAPSFGGGRTGQADRHMGAFDQGSGIAPVESPPRSPDTPATEHPSHAGQASRPTISWDLRQEEASSSGSQGRPASAKKSFASSLHVVEEEEAGLSMARSLKSRSKRMSSMASSLLYKLEMAELERQAEHMVEVESRAEVAEGERDAALDRMQLMTPRPALPPSIELPSTLGPEGSAKFLAALNKFRTWPASDLAGMLVGVTVDGSTSVLNQARFAFACLARPVYQRLLTQKNITLVLQEGSTKPLAEHMTGQQYAWLQGHLGAMSAEARRGSALMMASFLTGCSEQGFKYSSDFYGCLVPYKEKRNPVLVYVEKLAAADESAWKDFLEGMGTGADIPKLFRHAGKVKNKQVTKHFTEKTIKEVWKEKLAERKAGRESDMCDFVCNFFQKRIGIMSAVMGYNLLYGLWKYAWDADCELFLRIMQGEMKEDVYYQQIQLQEDLENLLSTLDKSMHGAETGSLTKAEVCSALEAFFAVGQPGGKTVNRFDELMQALDEDQDGPTVQLKKLFEEDREFNQG
ncbi:hypothetical protein COCSUDRAFT_64043 [Coccomyxa subellipsoidea C-169]|uniref:EF-hand domain-containing protein n=1 Tax=Coccomyxa subellipsoidea (strain C-169) TaxID=574566 RepID=I0YX05_COCSC|nr:hypothetical protein COCSUDRAFT_64043 [Coccomyxa subellipsoidea C-169]EIE22924.1 hypothetical protein COCSUDRAFT_64043 [Coccomyxa subellipsoidea C-169]|eukprot:XP_005647468.1 hypothetical protein COCSUDRAFT_64043 [Coccomyxa subellipsoidea C-169]